MDREQGVCIKGNVELRARGVYNSDDSKYQSGSLSTSIERGEKDRDHDHRVRKGRIKEQRPTI